MASAIDGIPEACDGGRAGWLVPVGDVPALANALDGLLSDPELLLRWRAAAQVSLERFSVARVAQEVEVAYREVTVTADGVSFGAILRLDTPREREYVRHGGILPYVLRRLLAG